MFTARPLKSLRIWSTKGGRTTKTENYNGLLLTFIAIIIMLLPENCLGSSSTMKRLLSPFLEKWLDQPGRKPLIVRGARQVGKTWLVRELAQSTRRTLVELNFEKQPWLAENFSSNEPSRILSELQADLGRTIDPARAILFLDEIQAALSSRLKCCFWLGSAIASSIPRRMVSLWEPRATRGFSKSSCSTSGLAASNSG
jgi:hypothetical protein